MTYTLGFMFSEDLDKLALICKLRPQWMAGKCNGIGGKVEEGETPVEAMRREFREETGHDAWVPWQHFGEMRGSGWSVRLFTVRGPVAALRSVTDEAVIVRRVCYLPDETCIENLAVLIPAALHALKHEDAGKLLIDYSLTNYGN